MLTEISDRETERDKRGMEKRNVVVILVWLGSELYYCHWQVVQAFDEFLDVGPKVFHSPVQVQAKFQCLCLSIRNGYVVALVLHEYLH